MLMTTNTLWTPPASENLGELIELTENDLQLLAELESYAATVAQAFQETIFASLSQNLLYVSPIEYKLGRVALEKWFVHLFREAHTVSASPQRENLNYPLSTRLHRKSGIPFRYMLGMMEIILRFGKRVTMTSVKPEQAFSAFQKVLGLEFARNQAYEELYISHLSELMLDD
ncbi:MAG: hypothetical protein Fur0022_33940 [Anaerolineales bacterium]